MRHEKKTFRDETVVLDDNEFVDCRFINCTLSFAGGKFHFERPGFGGTYALQVHGPCANMLLLLQMFAVDPAWKRYIIGLLDPRNTR